MLHIYNKKKKKKKKKILENESVVQWCAIYCIVYTQEPFILINFIRILWKKKKKRRKNYITPTGEKIRNDK